MTASAPAVQVIDPAWLKAITHADKTTNPEPLIAYLKQPGVQLGVPESFLLRLLLERMTFNRKYPGRFVPLGEQSRKEIHEIGAAYVRKLQQDERKLGQNMSRAKAIDKTVKTFEMWFKHDGGASLANYMQRSG